MDHTLFRRSLLVASASGSKFVFSHLLWTGNRRTAVRARQERLGDDGGTSV